jgi:hypothetical protein
VAARDGGHDPIRRYCWGASWPPPLSTAFGAERAVTGMKRSASTSRKLLGETAEWPTRWQGSERDLPLGRNVVSAMLPFLHRLGEADLADKTLRRHFTNAWVLGGEIVRCAYFDPEVRQLEGRDLLLRFVDTDGGPLLSGHTTEEEQRSFDATCKRLFRFLEVSASADAEADGR